MQGNHRANDYAKVCLDCARVSKTHGGYEMLNSSGELTVMVMFF